MDQRLELIDALLTLGKQAERVAKLLSTEIVGEMREETIITIPKTDISLDIHQYKQWPEAADPRSSESYAQLETVHLPSLSDLKILEYTAYPLHPVSHFHQHAKVDLLTDHFAFNKQPDNVRIINSFAEAKDTYDVGIIWETIEMHDNPPVLLLEMKKRCQKIIIKFRPWTARNGGYQESFINKAYAHLLMDLDTRVKFKVTRPLATYESLFSKAGLPILERRVNSSSVEEFLQNPDFMKVIIARTWGALREEEAIRIMMTDSVCYTVGK